MLLASLPGPSLATPLSGARQKFQKRLKKEVDTEARIRDNSFRNI
jgi:hypothetical protein